MTDAESSIGTRFTVDTVHVLKLLFPHTRFVWLMGSDNLEQVDQWRSWKTLFHALPIAVFHRLGYPATGPRSKAATVFAKAQISLSQAAQLAEMPPPAWIRLDNEPIDLSSTQLRSTEKDHATWLPNRKRKQRQKLPPKAKQKPKNPH